jgi:hypothetical protein
MSELKVGARVRSSVCTTEGMVVACPPDGFELTCGGAPMVAVGDDPAPGYHLDSACAGGTKIGKRYVDESGALEVLCTKAGEGTLAANGALLSEKTAKRLPSSD